MFIPFATYIYISQFSLTLFPYLILVLFRPFLFLRVCLFYYSRKCTCEYKKARLDHLEELLAPQQEEQFSHLSDLVFIQSFVIYQASNFLLLAVGPQFFFEFFFFLSVSISLFCPTKAMMNCRMLYQKPFSSSIFHVYTKVTLEMKRKNR